MVVGHLVHRYELGEDQHKDLILSYARHEQKLQVCPAPSLPLNLAHTKSLRRVLHWRLG